MNTISDTRSIKRIRILPKVMADSFLIGISREVVEAEANALWPFRADSVFRTDPLSYLLAAHFCNGFNPKSSNIMVGFGSQEGVKCPHNRYHPMFCDLRVNWDKWCGLEIWSRRINRSKPNQREYANPPYKRTRDILTTRPLQGSSDARRKTNQRRKQNP